MQKLFITVAIFAVAILSKNNDFVWVKWWSALSVATLFLSGLIWRRVHPSVALVFAVTVWNGVWAFAWPDNQFNGLPDTAVYLFERSAAFSSFAFLCFALILTLASRKHLRLLCKSFSLLCLVNSVVVIAQYVAGYSQLSGLFGATSMSGCLIAFTYPFLAFVSEAHPREWERRYKNMLYLLYILSAITLPVVAIFLTKSSMAIGTLAVVWLVFLWREYNKLGTGLLLFGAILLIAYLLDPTFFDQLHKPVFQWGRLRIWILSIHWWLAQDMQTFFVGTGLGSTEVLLPHIQYGEGHRGQHEWFLWMHNDWLQLLFEQGIIGLAVYLNAFFFALKASWKNVYLSSALIGVAVCALGNYPARLPVHGFILMAIVVMCFRLTHEARRES